MFLGVRGGSLQCCHIYSVVLVVTVNTNRSVFSGVREWFITVMSYIQCCHGSNSYHEPVSIFRGEGWFITVMSYIQCCHGSNSYHEPVSVFRGEGVVHYSVVIYTVLSW